MRPSQASPGIARQKRTPFSKDTVGVALLGIFVLQHFFKRLVHDCAEQPH